MREIEAEFENAGITVCFVVIGTQSEATEFCGRFGEPNRCLADPDKHTYEEMGLENFDLLTLFTNPELKRRRKENAAAGFHQDWRNTKLKNGAQLPGAAVIDREGTMRWIHRGKHPGDLPPMREMLAVARERLNDG